MSNETSLPAFAALGLPAPLLKALQQVGYETPSPIQSQCIPLLLEGHDLVGQAQTGTGKTAAFALPLLSRVDARSGVTQILCLAPTRELAIQVAEACQSYAKLIPQFHVLPIYGGQSFGIQLRQLQRGVQVVVGTPGRVMDHMRRGTLKLDSLQALVLDEADEMLRMGFIDDVEWILGHTPEDCQIALFSATMPKEIRKVAEKYLNEPKEVRIAAKTSTATTINQRCVFVNQRQKLDAMTRILEVEPFEAIITFVRTKVATTELADKLCARGYSAEALNGDIPQARREKIVAQLKEGKLDIVVATDVAARGLDVERISHVINYDIPTDTEAYVHRIGRTGRAGRKGEAILFVTRREQRMLKAIERSTKQSITEMRLPSVRDLYATRLARFKQRIGDVIASEELDFYQQLVADYQREQDTDLVSVAAALAYLAQGNQPLQQKETEEFVAIDSDSRTEKSERPPRSKDREGAKKSRPSGDLATEAKPLKDFPDVEMRRYRVELGYDHGVKPGNLVGAIANEAGLESCYIGHIEIFDEFSTIDLPEGMPKEILRLLKNVWVCQRKLNITPLSSHSESAKAPVGKPSNTPRKRNKSKPAGDRSKGAKARSGNRDSNNRGNNNRGSNKGRGRPKS